MSNLPLTAVNSGQTEQGVQGLTLRSRAPIRPQSHEYEMLLTEQDAIEALGLADRKNPTGALRWLIRNKRLGCVRVARGIVRFRPCDIQDFIERCHEKAD
ncbi:MAG: hypothetical protein QUV05_20950 [Phycisphaerae bacterium]|nr:hypothetical protein [Phycisphaerae bacterium]